MHGGELRLTDIRLRPESKPDNYVMFTAPIDGETVSFTSCVLLILKGLVGTDPVFTSTMFDYGIVSIMFMHVVMLLIFQLSFHIFFRTWVLGEAYHYHEVWRNNIGKWMEVGVLFLVLISFLDRALWQVYDLFADLKRFILEFWPTAPDLLVDEWVLMYGVSLMTTLPCLFIKKFTGFIGISIVGFVCLIVILISLVISVVRSVLENGFDPNKEIKLMNMGMLDIYPIINRLQTAFFVGPMVSYLTQTMDRPTVGRILKATWVANALSFLFHTMISLLGYLTFCGVTYEDNVMYFLNGRQPEVIAGQIASYILSVTTIAFVAYFMAKTIATIIIPGTDQDRWAMSVSGLLAMTLYLSLHFLHSRTRAVIELASDVARVLLVFVLPPVFYLIQFRFTNKLWSCGSIFMLFIGLPMAGFFVLIASNHSL